MATSPVYTDLTDEEVDALGGRGQRGQYKALIEQFIADGVRGRRFSASAMGVKTATIAVGFTKAKASLGEQAQSVRVVTNSKDESVALVNSAA